MRAFISTTVALVLIIAYGITSHYVIINDGVKLVEQMENILENLDQEDWAKAKNGLSYGNELWKKSRLYWSILVDHDDLDNIDNSFERLEKYIQTQEKGLSLAETAALKLLIESIVSEERITLKNIL